MIKQTIRISIIVSIFFLLGIKLHCGNTGAESPGDPLWQKAVELTRKNKEWVPGTITMKIDELDKTGTPKKTHETLMKIALDENGKIKSEIIKSVEDGQDVTEKYKAEHEKEQNEKDKNNKESVSFGSDYSPFNPDLQDKVSVKPTGLKKELFGKICIEFEYTQQLKDGPVKGIAWLVEDTGVPVELQSSPDPLPKRVSKMITTVRYEFGSDESFYAVEMNVEAEGGILFFRKQFHMHMEFKDYWKYIEQNNTNAESKN